jgi:hypothetical protein
MSRDCDLGPIPWSASSGGESVDAVEYEKSSEDVKLQAGYNSSLSVTQASKTATRHWHLEPISLNEAARGALTRAVR